MGGPLAAGSRGTVPVPDLSAEASALRGAQEGRVGLVGAGDDGGHGALVSGGRGGQKGQGSQWNVVLGAGQAVAVMAVGAQAGGGGVAGGWGPAAPPLPLPSKSPRLAGKPQRCGALVGSASTLEAFVTDPVPRY